MKLKKRDRSMFAAVDMLESQDSVAAKKRKSSKTDVSRSKAATSQSKVYGSIMECRILLQRSIQPSNASTSSTDDDDTETSTSPAKNKKAVQQCNSLLEKLLQARQRLVPTVVSDTNDSDNDNEEDEKEIDYKKLIESNDSFQLNQLLQSQYETCRTDWKQVLDRRHKDVRLHSGITAKAQFRVMDSSFWEQVDATVQHEKLRQSQSGDDEKVFDDTKVYQHLLKDFVLASQTGNQEAAQQRLKHSKSTKKMVDRKASKGRKIRYHEIPKLVNFTFPLSRPNTGSNLNQDEWFRSLFGGAGNRS